MTEGGKILADSCINQLRREEEASKHEDLSRGIVLLEGLGKAVSKKWN